MKIRIEAGTLWVVAEVDDSVTARAIAAALPLEGSLHRWGDEVYFEVPFHVDQSADAREEMSVGELGFWPIGDAVCVFFGPTPVSVVGEPRAYSPVNPFGMVVGDATVLRAVHDGDRVHMSRLDAS